MRIIGRVRAQRHGGTFIIMPDERIDEFLTTNPHLNFKYKFVSEKP